MRENADFRFSLIIPAHNEQDYLPALLDTVDAACINYKGGSNTIEVIATDNASTDSTAEIDSARGCLVVNEEKRIIAAVRNAGAAAARGEILTFVDADTRIHPDTFNVIDHTMSNDRIIAGATGASMERISPGIFITYIFKVLYGMCFSSGRTEEFAKKYWYDDLDKPG